MGKGVCFAVGSPVLGSSTEFVPRKQLDALCTRRSAVLGASPKRRARVSMGLFGLGVPELVVIAGVGVLIFGPGKISEMGKELGGFAGGVKKATADFKEAMEESLEEADREIELKKLKKESGENKTVETSVKAVDESSGEE